MRPPCHGDAVMAARVLFDLRACSRVAALEQMIAAADMAADFLASNRRLHPSYGDGSLMAVAARRHPSPEPALDDPEYCGCLAAVYARLASIPVSSRRNPGT